ncbi:MAG: TetR/AcrR family transcriptional regulator, partial [Lachnospiraceae bacterium]|nr:TetR/AcrR family transcriptional regulator [Lachnospiraceae bacterium]
MAKSTKRDKPVNKPKQKRSIETRNKILEVGSMLMLKEGYHNVTTDDIAKAAGLSTGIVYHYFKDKKDILLI